MCGPFGNKLKDKNYVKIQGRYCKNNPNVFKVAPNGTLFSVKKILRAKIFDAFQSHLQDKKDKYI
jgi:hypothetical protein